MKKLCYIAAAAALLAAGGVSAQELRIGFLTTTTGGGAVLGVPLLNGWKLGLEHEGWTKDGDKLGGVPTRMFYADDQLKPDVALKEAEKIVMDNMAILPVYQKANAMMIKTGVKDIQCHAIALNRVFKDTTKE